MVGLNMKKERYEDTIGSSLQPELSYLMKDHNNLPICAYTGSTMLTYADISNSSPMYNHYEYKNCIWKFEPVSSVDPNVYYIYTELMGTRYYLYCFFTWIKAGPNHPTRNMGMENYFRFEILNIGKDMYTIMSKELPNNYYLTSSTITGGRIFFYHSPYTWTITTV